MKALLLALLLAAGCSVESTPSEQPLPSYSEPSEGWVRVFNSPENSDDHAFWKRCDGHNLIYSYGGYNDNPFTVEYDSSECGGNPYPSPSPTFG